MLASIADMMMLVLEKTQAGTNTTTNQTAQARGFSSTSPNLEAQRSHGGARAAVGTCIIRHHAAAGGVGLCAASLQ